jgi:hypothetical protein
MRSTTRPVRACTLVLAGLVLLGCSAPPSGVAGAETDAPAATAATGQASADPDEQETASSGGSGGGSTRLVKLPAGGGGGIEVVDGEGCAAIGGSSTEAAVTVTIAEVRLEPAGTVLLPGPCGGGSAACAGLVWQDSFGGCTIRFAPAPGATTLDVELLGTVVCEDPAECAKAYALWESSGDVVLHWSLTYPGPAPAESASGTTDPDEETAAPDPEVPQQEPGPSPPADGG